jgi:hypothetical protein
MSGRSATTAPVSGSMKRSSSSSTSDPSPRSSTAAYSKIGSVTSS